MIRKHMTYENTYRDDIIVNLEYFIKLLNFVYIYCNKFNKPKMV